ncbi:MAG: hypothetical protein AB7G28_01570 [Pirellulales bacterium]
MSVRHPQQLSAGAGKNWFRLAIGRQKSSQPLRFVGLLIVVALVSGCSSEAPRLPVFPVKGKVTYKGQPADGAQVVLFPVNTEVAAEIAPSARVQKDGSFAITAYDSGDGAPEGDYVVTLSWRKVVKDKAGDYAGPNVIPKQYGSAATSPVKVSVKGAPTEIPLIAIK